METPNRETEIKAVQKFKVASIIRSGINGNGALISAVARATSVASIIRSGINGNHTPSVYLLAAEGNRVASIIRSGINGNKELSSRIVEGLRLGKSLLLLEVELMETRSFVYNL